MANQKPRGERFNTQPPEGGWGGRKWLLTTKPSFQHAAARRRLGDTDFYLFSDGTFQHAAARRRLETSCDYIFDFVGFNTQPPEGGWKKMFRKYD